MEKHADPGEIVVSPATKAALPAGAADVARAQGQHHVARAHHAGQDRG